MPQRPSEGRLRPHQVLLNLVKPMRPQRLRQGRVQAKVRPTLAALLLLLCMTGATSGCDLRANALPNPEADDAQSGNSPSGGLETRDRFDLNNDTLVTRIRVRTDAVAERSIAAGANATGVVLAFRKSVVAAEAGGSVVNRRVEPGALVKAGQVLIELDANRSQIAFDRANAEVQAREVDYAQAEHELLRGRRLIESNVISQDTLDDLRFNLDRSYSVLNAAKAQRNDAARSLSDSKIQAPFAGTAEIVHVQTGDYLAPGTPVVTLADFSKVRVVAGVTAAAAGALRVGEVAQVTLGAGANASIEGTIKSIGRIADSNGTFPLELWITGDVAKSLREGMVATVQLPDAKDQRVVSVPRSAILRKDGQVYVYVLDSTAGNTTPDPESGVAKLRSVSLGRSDAQFTQILEGVNRGEHVIIEGLFALRDGAPVELLE